MKPLDLNSLVDSYNCLTKELFNDYMCLLNITIKNEEILHMQRMIESLNIDNKHWGYFYVGYNIPQISKEFDLLRFGKDYIINIELKTCFTGDKVKRQLLRNKYYLSALNKKVKLFTYIYDEKRFYTLTDKEELSKVDFKEVEEELIKQTLDHIQDLNNLFNPSNYLVSPFNEPEKFINEAYFLTDRQEKNKNEILRSDKQFVIIKGNPGTGKTLLLYDLFNYYIGSQESILIHTGNLNNGHLILKQYDLPIIPVKYIEKVIEKKPDIILVDESQRMNPRKLKKLIDYVTENEKRIIFSIDPKQTLALHENSYNNIDTLQGLSNAKSYKLSTKIRTNKELGAFIKGLFNLEQMKYCRNLNNVAIHYYDNIDKARGFAESLEEEYWQIIDYTGQQFNGLNIERMKLNRGLNAHRVIGQEFDKVVVLIGSLFYYNDKKSIQVRGANHYDPLGMFYQSITRARKEIMLIIVDNIEFMSTLINYLPQKRNEKL